MSSRQIIGILFGIFIFLIGKTSGELRRIIPSELEIREGEDMQLRLSTVLSEESSCYIRTPWLETINLKIDEDEDNDRIKYWSENDYCGVQVTNVRKEDQGWWRIFSRNDFNKKILVDAVNVRVLDKADFHEYQYQIKSGLGYNLLLGFNSKYCTVERPNSGKSIEILNENCVVDLEEPTQADAGLWIAQVGLKGQIEEKESSSRVTIYQERLMSGYQKNGSYLHLYCNVLNYEGVPDLCRFSQPDRYQSAFRLREGLRKGRYGYYGNGLAKGFCGLTITDPKPGDFLTWFCRVGQIGKRIFGDYIRIPIPLRKAEDVIVQSVSPVITTTSKELILQCSANIPLKYCWFLGPNGTILTPTEFFSNINSITNSAADFPNDFISHRYFGKGLKTGECGIKVASAEETYNGTWTCHMGPTTPGLEITANIEVRISETQLAARNKVIFVENNRDSVSIKCETVPHRVELQYCRFYSPSGIGIHINEEITKENYLVIGTTKIWFNGTSTKLGDCGITFQDISLKDYGTWRCVAKLEALKHGNESFDTIEIILKEQGKSENLTAAASAGIGVGVIVVFGVIIATITYMMKKKKGIRTPHSPLDLSSTEQSPRQSSNQSTNMCLQHVSKGSSELSSESDR